VIIKATDKNFPDLIELWELSVRATHHFLDEEYLQLIKNLLPEILPSVEIYISINEKEIITGFLGMAGKKIEMVFIHPGYIGKGYGKALTQFAIEQLNMEEVDVNEQNENAVKFYRHLGFVVYGRSEFDGLGKPYPLLHMSINRNRSHDPASL